MVEEIVKPEKELIIEQTWWHVEDQIKPSKARTLSPVIDLYANKKFLKLTLPETNFVGLDVRCRNMNIELPYIEINDDDKEEHVVVNLGNNILFDAYIENKENKDELPKDMKHFRLEVKYTLIDPQIKTFKFDTSYISAFGVNDDIQPEFYITTPLGMEIKKKNNEYLFSIFYKEDNNELTELKLEGPHISHEDGKKTYCFLIAYDEYLKIKEIQKSKNENIDSNGRYEVLYEASYENKFYIPLVASIALIFVSFASAYIGAGTSALPLLVIWFSVLYADLALSKEGYVLPFNAITRAVLIISLILILISLIFSSQQANQELTKEMVFNSTNILSQIFV